MMAEIRSFSSSDSNKKIKNNLVTPIRVRLSNHKILDSSSGVKKKGKKFKYCYYSIFQLFSPKKSIFTSTCFIGARSTPKVVKKISKVVPKTPYTSVCLLISTKSKIKVSNFFAFFNVVIKCFSQLFVFLVNLHLQVS